MIIILHGPSGSGKTLAGERLKTLGIKELISHTTRAIRPGEVHGEAYYFVSLDVFNDTPKIEESVYAGEHYGVSREEVSKKYKDGWVFAVTDRSGVRAFLKQYKTQVVVIKILASPRNMRARMIKRGESKSTIHNRMKIFLNDQRTGDDFLSDFIIYNNSTVKTFYYHIEQVILKVKCCSK